MPYRPSFRQLEYVVALDDLRHFGQAATRCHVSQPTLSVQLAQLERHLGALLFDRTAGPITPTPLGSEVAQRARLLLADLDDIVRRAEADHGRLGGLIRLGTVASLGPYMLPALLPRLHHKYPELRLYIREDRPLDIEKAVEDGAIDCALALEPTNAALTFRAVGIERIWVGVPGEHPLAGQEVLRLQDLAGLPFLSLGAGHRLAESLLGLTRAAKARLIDDYEGTSLDAIRQMVSIGMGLSIFPDLYARAEFKDATDVRLKPVQDWAGERRFGFVWRAGAGRKAHFEALAQEARAVANEWGLQAE